MGRDIALKRVVLLLSVAIAGFVALGRVELEADDIGKGMVYLLFPQDAGRVELGRFWMDDHHDDEPDMEWMLVVGRTRLVRLGRV